MPFEAVKTRGFYAYQVRLSSNTRTTNEPICYCVRKDSADMVAAALNAFTEPPDEPSPDATPNNVPYAGQ